jgi:hypothetical protein
MHGGKDSKKTALDGRDKNNTINQPADPEIMGVRFNQDSGILI